MSAQQGVTGGYRMMPAQDPLFGAARRLREANDRLRREVAAHEATLRELEVARRDLEVRVAERTKELSIVTARFETALRGAKIYVFSQDRDLRYTWFYSPRGDGADMLGRTDDEILSSPERDFIVAVKRRVLATGSPQDCEVPCVVPDGRAPFALRVDPTFGPDNAVDGIMCAAIDMSRIRSLESEQRRLADELRTALQRYQTALRGSKVTVFTQDRELRYTSISNPILGRRIEGIIGQTDECLLPLENRASIIALKTDALESGIPQHAEVSIAEGSGVRWYDLHVEPLRDDAGSIVGLICASVDVTERKEDEAHLRLLMRELTHRSKNLLAIIEAMARQTARSAGSIDAFVDQFGARIQALATSHDLLVQESWHGVLLHELVRSQLGHYLDRGESQVILNGPAIVLKPEVAQSLGLAFHELAANAARFGALSVAAGRVAVTWQRCSETEGRGLEILWSEDGGPKVREPERRGFGRMVIERSLTLSLAADVDLAFAPAGVRCRLVLPASRFSAQ